MNIEEATERLRTLGVFLDTPEQPNSVRENAGIFQRCGTLDEIGQECGTRHWGCGSGQFLYFQFGSLLKTDPEYRARFFKEATRELGNLGVRTEHIEEYFQTVQDGCGDPGLAFTFRHEGEYGRRVRVPFYDRADQFALNKMREWLGLRQEGP